MPDWQPPYPDPSLEVDFGGMDALLSWVVGCEELTDHLDRPRAADWNGVMVERARDLLFVRLPVLTGRQLRSACATLHEDFPCYIPQPPEMMR